MRLLLLLSLLPLVAPTLFAEAVRLPNGRTENFSPLWATETELLDGQPVLSKLRWRGNNGPEITFQRLDPQDSQLAATQSRWMPIALADQGLRVIEHQPLPNSTETSPGHRFVAEAASKQRVIVETKFLPGPVGVLRLVFRYPEALPADVATALTEVRNRFLNETSTTPAGSISQSERLPLSARPLQAVRAATLEPGEFVRQHYPSMVIVSDQGGGGSGFVCRLEGRPMLITNIHVAASSGTLKFTNLQGKAIEPGRLFAATGRDIMAMETSELPGIFEIHPALGEVKVGDPVFVLGNSGAAGVVHPIRGKVVGIGPDLIEVDAPFIPGNSGSPIIHQASGKVIAVATYLTILPNEFGPRGYQGEVIRRYGFRLDGITQWQPIDWKTLLAEQRKLSSLKLLTSSLIKLIDDMADDGRLDPALHQHPALRGHVQNWDQAQRPSLSAKAHQDLNAQLARFLKSASERDIQEALRTLRYDYFIREAKLEAQQREKITELFRTLGER